MSNADVEWPAEGYDAAIENWLKTSPKAATEFKDLLRDDFHNLSLQLSSSSEDEEQEEKEKEGQHATHPLAQPSLYSPPSQVPPTKDTTKPSLSPSNPNPFSPSSSSAFPSPSSISSRPYATPYSTPLPRVNEPTFPTPSTLFSPPASSSSFVSPLSNGTDATVLYPIASPSSPSSSSFAYAPSSASYVPSSSQPPPYPSSATPYPSSFVPSPSSQPPYSSTSPSSSSSYSPSYAPPLSSSSFAHPLYSTAASLSSSSTPLSSYVPSYLPSLHSVNKEKEKEKEKAKETIPQSERRNDLHRFAATNGTAVSPKTTSEQNGSLLKGEVTQKKKAKNYFESTLPLKNGSTKVNDERDQSKKTEKKKEKKKRTTSFEARKKQWNEPFDLTAEEDEEDDSILSNEKSSKTKKERERKKKKEKQHKKNSPSKQKSRLEPLSSTSTEESSETEDDEEDLKRESINKWLKHQQEAMKSVDVPFRGMMDWSALNLRLQANAFPTLPLSSSLGSTGLLLQNPFNERFLFQTIQELLIQFERRGQLIQELIESSSHYKLESRRAKSHSRTLQNECDRLRRKLSALKQERATLQNQLGETEKKMKAEREEEERRQQGLKRQNLELRLRMEEKDKEIEQLKEAVKHHMQKERERIDRDRAILENLVGSAGSSKAAFGSLRPSPSTFKQSDKPRKSLSPEKNGLRSLPLAQAEGEESESETAESSDDEI